MVSNMFVSIPSLTKPLKVQCLVPSYIIKKIGLTIILKEKPFITKSSHLFSAFLGKFFFADLVSHFRFWKKS